MPENMRLWKKKKRKLGMDVDTMVCWSCHTEFALFVFAEYGDGRCTVIPKTTSKFCPICGTEQVDKR